MSASSDQQRDGDPGRVVNPYVGEDGVPRNKLGITDARELRREEYRITRARALELREQPIVGQYDLTHLKAIHRHLFQDVYQWAGETRTINFSKRSESHPGFKGVFADRRAIPELADQVHAFTASRGNLAGMSRTDFVPAISNVYASWNYIHPFPEGNGRATQLFIAQLSKDAGHEIDYTHVKPERWNAAASASMEKTHMREPGLKLPADMGQVRRVFEDIVMVRDQDRGTSRAAESHPGPQR